MFRAFIKTVFLLLIPVSGNVTSSFANLKLNIEYIGVYSSVTESQCNIELKLYHNNEGVLSESCRLENGSHSDVVETRSVKWNSHDQVLEIELKDEIIEFNFTDKMSCSDFGDNGFANGVLIVKKENNFMDGYGKKLWRQPIKCM